MIVVLVRCCFVSPFPRAQIYAKNTAGAATDQSFKEAPSVDYPLGPETIIRIPGLVREFACEVLFEQDIDGRSVATLILDALIQVRNDFNLLSLTPTSILVFS